MITNVWRKRHRLHFLVLLVLNVGLLVIYNNLENLTAEVRSFLRFHAPIKSVPTPTWSQVGNVFLKRSSWNRNEDPAHSEISGCTLPKVMQLSFYPIYQHNYSSTPGTQVSSVMFPPDPSLGVSPGSLRGCSTPGTTSSTLTWPASPGQGTRTSGNWSAAWDTSAWWTASITSWAPRTTSASREQVTHESE